MEKSLKYSLSIFVLVCCLFACNKIAETKQEINENLLLMQRKSYYQASKYRHDLTEQLIALNPSKAEYYQGQSMGHTKIGDYHLAFPLLEKAYELDPKEIGYYYGWLLLYYYRDYERSIKRLNEYDDLTPNQPDFCWGEHINFLKGLCYKQMGKYDKAVEEFNTLIEYEGEYVDVYGYVYRGISFLKLENYTNAINDFDLAIKAYDKCAMAYYYKGLCYEKLGNIKLAKEQYFEAQTLIEHGYLQIEPYYEMFDAISEEMVSDRLNEL